MEVRLQPLFVESELQNQMSRLHGRAALTMIRSGAVATIVVVATGLAGCSTHEEPPVSLDSLVGNSVAQVRDKMSSDSSLATYDLSYPLNGSKATYSASSHEVDNQWRVVSACAPKKYLKDNPRVAIGIVKADTYSKKVERKAKKHTFDRNLEECK